MAQLLTIAAPGRSVIRQTVFAMIARKVCRLLSREEGVS